MKKTLSNEELFHFCEQFYILLHSGISCAEGLQLLYEDSQHPDSKEIFQQLITSFEETGSLAQSLKNAKLFPDSMISFIKAGEETGCLDEVMKSLSERYEQEIAISKTLKSAVTYPLLMLFMMGIVIVILLSRVLPVFQQVFRQMGLEMNQLSNGLLKIGTAFSRYSTVVLCVIMLVIFACIFLYFTEKGRTFFRQMAQRLPYLKNISVSIDYSRLTQAMAMAMHSGLDHNTSLEMSLELVQNPLIKEKAQKALSLLEEGSLLEEALSQSELFQGMNARLITVGLHAGAADEVMQKLSQRYQEDCLGMTESVISVLEPSIVILFSVLVGLVLLSVMLPLLGILSEIMI